MKSKDLEFVQSSLKYIVNELKITEEIKWGKVGPVKLDAFKKLMDEFFLLVLENKIKVRIMFRQNSVLPKGLNFDQINNTYFLLYYQFIKHAFGFKYTNNSKKVNLRLHFDTFPSTISKVMQFKEFIKG